MSSTITSTASERLPDDGVVTPDGDQSIVAPTAEAGPALIPSDASATTPGASATAIDPVPPSSIDAHAPAHRGTALEQMANVRRLVREQGMAPEEAARATGVDPIIAQLWLRLPDDLWPSARAATAPAPSLVAPSAPATPPAPLNGLRRVLTCRIPAPALDRLRAGDSPLIEAAVNALENGSRLPRPDPSPGGWRFARKPLAVPIPAVAYAAVAELAGEAFNGDLREAAGWLIARGTGMALPLPTAEELSGAPRLTGPAPTERVPAAPAAAPRFVVAPRRRPETRAPLPPDDSAPSGDELRSRRDAVGISQRDLAAAAGLSRGLIAEVERGRRRHVYTRLRIAETLASLQKSK